MARLSWPCQFGSGAGVPEWDCVPGSSSIPPRVPLLCHHCVVGPVCRWRVSKPKARARRALTVGGKERPQGPCGAGLGGARKEMNKPMPTVSRVGPLPPVTCA